MAPQYRTQSAVIIAILWVVAVSLLGWGDDPGVGLRPLLSGSRISLNPPTLFEASLCSLIPLRKRGKYSGQTSLSRRNSGFLKPAVAKKTAKNSGQ